MKTFGILVLLSVVFTFFEAVVEHYSGFEFHPDGYKLVTYSQEFVLFVCAYVFAKIDKG